MFEKEAEEWVMDCVCKDCSLYEKCKSKEHCTCKECSKDKWQNGAEFGYQKGVQKLDKKWHSLQKNPKDLPEPHSTVLDECGDKITYRGGDMWTVYSEYYEKDIDAEPPKAWCEVPTFEE